MNLGNTIKSIRKRKNIKQNTFAKICNLSQTYLSQIENNQKEPNISTLKKISLKLEIPLPILFFLSLEETDISKQKRKAFNIIGPTIKSLINELLSDA